MKKLISLLTALCLVALMVPALAESADVTGEWYGTLYGAALTLTLNEDGTYTLSSGGTVVTTGTWELKEDKVIMDGQETEDSWFVYDGSSLVNEIAGANFTRNPDDAVGIELADPNPDATAEDFNGSWTCCYVKMNGVVLDLASNLEMMGMEKAPAMVIDNGAVTFDGLDALFGEMGSAFTFEYADGAMSYNLMDMMTFNITLLQDGMAVLDFGLGDESPAFIFAPAAAEEAPAA